MLGIKIIEISSYDILKLEGTVKYIDGQLITEMSKDEYQEFSSREVNSNLKEERKNKNVNKKLTGKIKKMSRKTFVELCFKEFKEEIDKMNNKLNSEGCYVKRKIDNYFLEKIKEIDQLNNCESEFELYIDYFYRSLGYSIITPSTYNISFLKASNIDYKEEDKIIISRELKDKLYIAHKR
ncbi:hypothetical protein G7035_20000 [Paenibacillus polymyxa]|nr:hypothetical protein [Paenibacillus polymyxa]QPK54748.1 hypothetical protein G7035_20000 [Paenibacillus polymyxa]